MNASHGGNQTATEHTPAGDTLRLALSGISCAGCVRSVQRALDATPGVQHAEVNFGSRTAQVHGNVSAERLIEAVQGAGYGAEVIEDLQRAEGTREANEAREYRRRLRDTALGLGLGVPLMISMFFHHPQLLGGERWLWLAVGLATLGVLLTALITAPVARFALDLNWSEALLASAVVASTDAAAVFLLIHSQGLRLRPRIGAMLEVESGTNDPFAVFLTLMLVELISLGDSSVTHVLAEFFQ